MADRPIPFSPVMVRALLAGRKTQTRRIVKIPAIMGNRVPVGPHEDLIELEDGEFWRGICHYASTGALSGPYKLAYAVGDRLWVREAWRTYRDDDRWSGRKIVDFAEESGSVPTIQYSNGALNTPDDAFVPGRYRHARFMPRALPRLTTTVADVRVQRLQDISEEDAMAEGVCQFVEETDRQPWGDTLTAADRHAIVVATYGSAVRAYSHLIDTIHGAGTWDANRWVGAYTFAVPTIANIDEVAHAAA